MLITLLVICPVSTHATLLSVGVVSKYVNCYRHTIHYAVHIRRMTPNCHYSHIPTLTFPTLQQLTFALCILSLASKKATVCCCCFWDETSLCTVIRTTHPDILFRAFYLSSFSYFRSEPLYHHIDISIGIKHQKMLLELV